MEAESMTTQPHQAAERTTMDAKRYTSMEAKRADVWPGRYDGIRPLLTPPKHINPDVEDYEFGEED